MAASTGSKPEVDEYEDSSVSGEDFVTNHSETVTIMAPPQTTRTEEELQDYTAETEQISNSSFPQSQIVIRLNPYIQPAAVSWLVKKITGKKQEGGAELLVRCEPYTGRRKEVTTFKNAAHSR